MFPCMLDEHSADVYDLECNFTSFKAQNHCKNDLSFQLGFLEWFLIL